LPTGADRSGTVGCRIAHPPAGTGSTLQPPGGREHQRAELSLCSAGTVRAEKRAIPSSSSVKFQLGIDAGYPPPFADSKDDWFMDGWSFPGPSSRPG
jgi:hypothetical protein